MSSSSGLNLLQVVLLVAAAAEGAVLECKGSNNDLFQGSRLPGDRMLYSGDILGGVMEDRNNTQLPFVVQRMEFKYPLPGWESTDLISRIEAVEKRDMFVSSCPTIVSGGIGQKQLKLEFTSKPGHSIAYHIIIYGQPVKLSKA